MLIALVEKRYFRIELSKQSYTGAGTYCGQAESLVVEKGTLPYNAETRS